MTDWTDTGTPITPGTLYGWVSIAEADAYMLTRIGAANYWVSGAEKEAALQTAYNDLVYCGRFLFPDMATQAMKDAQCEQALFHLLEGSGIDARMGLQVQGVVQAGIVKETYQGFQRGSNKNSVVIPICPLAASMLASIRNDSNAYLIDIERTENEEDTE